MVLNDYGKIVQNEWDKSFEIRRELLCDEFVVMPNHFHGIVRVVKIGENRGVSVGVGDDADVVGTHGRASLRVGVAYRTPKSISSFMAGVKSVITKRINLIRNSPGANVFHPRFHDHIIRNDNELFRIRQYIKNNPANWEQGE